MKKMKTILVAAPLLACLWSPAFAGDLRSLIVIPGGTLAVTNAPSAGGPFTSNGTRLPVRANATAHVVAWEIGASATATNVTMTDVKAGAGYTNSLAFVNTAITANSLNAISVQPTVGDSDTLVVTLNATNAVATYIYIHMQGY